jgi:hypothetical protein
MHWGQTHVGLRAHEEFSTAQVKEVRERGGEDPEARV